MCRAFFSFILVSSYILLKCWNAIKSEEIIWWDKKLSLNLHKK